jgi:hypothetical protein
LSSLDATGWNQTAVLAIDSLRSQLWIVARLPVDVFVPAKEDLFFSKFGVMGSAGTVQAQVSHDLGFL